MERYESYSEPIVDVISGKQRYASTFYPEFPYSDSDIYIYSKSSHRLDLLAYEYYGDQTLWWIIARVNNLGKGSFNVPPGRRLRIPFPVNVSY